MGDANLGIIINHKQKSYDFFDQFYAKTITITTKNHMILIWIYQRLNHMIVEMCNHMIIHLSNHMISMNNYHMKLFIHRSYNFTSIQSYELPVAKSYDFCPKLSY